MPVLLPSQASTNFDLLRSQLNPMFAQALQNTPTYFDKKPGLVRKIKGTTLTEVYAWPDRVGKLVQWMGGSRQMSNLAVRIYALPHVKYAQAVPLDVDVVSDISKIGLYSAAIQGLGNAAKRQPDILIANALINGAAAAANTFDAVPFFSASHPINPDNPSSATQSNYYSSGKALNAANFLTVLANMRAMSGADGTPIGISEKLLLMVPPALEVAAKQLMQGTFFTPGAAFGAANNTGPSDNVPFRGIADVIVNDYLASAFGGSDTAWYLFDVGQMFEPLLYQELEPPTLQVRSGGDPNAWEHFHENALLAGVRMRAAAGYGLYLFAAKAVA